MLQASGTTEGETTYSETIVIQTDIINTLSNSSYVTTANIDEDELDTISVGQEAQIEIEALDKIKVTGYVTKISNSGTYSSSGSKFGVTVTFQNDGEILLGMTAKCSIVLEKAENVIAVAKESITESNGKSYVKVKDENGNMTTTEITTGIENDAYVEVKSGLSVGDIVYIEKESNSLNRFKNRQMQGSGNERSQGQGRQNGGEMTPGARGQGNSNN